MFKLLLLLLASLFDITTAHAHVDDDGDDNDSDAGGSDDDDDGDDGDQDDDDPDWESEASKWKQLARKWENRAKENSKAKKDLDELRKQGMTDQEKAIEAARDEARNEERAKVGARLVAAEIKVAAAGRLDDEALDTLIENLNTANFLTDDGEVDTEKVKDLVDGVVPAKGEEDDPGTGKKKRPDMGQGRRKGTSKASVTTGADRYRERHGSTKKE